MKKNKINMQEVSWKSDLPRLLNEIMSNPSCSILYQPINITKNLLGRLAEYALELNDTKLNCFMISLGLYERSEETLNYLHKHKFDITEAEND